MVNEQRRLGPVGKFVFHRRDCPLGWLGTSATVLDPLPHESCDLYPLELGLVPLGPVPPGNLLVRKAVHALGLPKAPVYKFTGPPVVAVMVAIGSYHWYASVVQRLPDAGIVFVGKYTNIGVHLIVCVPAVDHQFRIDQFASVETLVHVLKVDDPFHFLLAI